MEKKFTFYAKMVAYTIFTLAVLAFNSFTAKTYAQNNCTEQKVVFLETFGTGTTSTGNPDIITSALTYWPTGSLSNEATYRLSNSTQQKPEWHASEDMTPGDINGKMLIVNGTAKDFYSHLIDQPEGIKAGDYTAQLYLMNINTPGTCGETILIPAITLRVEYLSEANTWVPLGGSPLSSGPVVQTINSTWVVFGSKFTLPGTADFVVKKIRIILTDGTVAGCGNDFAIDDITFSQCVGSGGPLPVGLLNINARQKGSGISVEWSTSQEINSKSFVIEKSANGNSNWTLVSSINAAGNSSTVKNYNLYDPQPIKGVNFYHIKQVDKDGDFSYSKTVNVKLNFIKTGVSVIANPFHNVLTVDFSSATNQVVSARLTDITGKRVAFEKWAITTGSTRKDFTNVNALQNGIYILTVSNAVGEIIHNSKVIRQ